MTKTCELTIRYPVSVEDLEFCCESLKHGFDCKYIEINWLNKEVTAWFFSSNLYDERVIHYCPFCGAKLIVNVIKEGEKERNNG